MSSIELVVELRVVLPPPDMNLKKTTTLYTSSVDLISKTCEDALLEFVKDTEKLHNIALDISKCTYKILSESTLNKIRFSYEYRVDDTCFYKDTFKVSYDPTVTNSLIVEDEVREELAVTTDVAEKLLDVFCKKLRLVITDMDISTC